MTADTRTPWGSTITVEVVTSLAGVEPPTWMDISDRVSFRELGQITVTNGRQSDLSGDEPAQLSIAFRDDDHLFTVGDILRAGRRIRVRESFGLATFDLIDAEIQVPTTATAMDLADGSQAEITVSVAATDQLGRLRDARKFISMLIEYIRFTGGSALQYLWTLADPGPALTFTNAVGTPTPVIFSTQAVNGLLATDTNVAGGNYIIPNGATPILADDITSVAFVTDLNTTFAPPAVYVSRWMRTVGKVDVLCSDVVTVAFWLYPDTTRGDGAGAGLPCGLVKRDPLTGLVIDSVLITSDPGDGVVWRAVFSVADGAAGVVFNPIPRPRPNAWSLIGLQMSLTDGTATAYIHNADPVTGAMTGPVPASQQFDRVIIGDRMNGSVGTVQIYLGAGAYSQAIHNAQIAMAQRGLAGQLTGQRVNSILDYAGVPAGRRDIDPGVATMSVARLAGKDPLTCLEEPRRTEQGRLFASGDRRIQFRDRQRAYNA